MKHFILIAALLLMLASCGSMRHASTTRIDRDSTYMSTQRLDSLFRAIAQHDSIFVRDSIFIREKGDTVTKYVERTRYRYKTRTDTLYKDRLLRDTVFINRTDSVTVEKPVYIEKPIKWYNKAFIYCGRLCCLAAILWALFLYLKRKF